MNLFSLLSLADTSIIAECLENIDILLYFRIIWSSICMKYYFILLMKTLGLFTTVPQRTTSTTCFWILFLWRVGYQIDRRSLTLGAYSKSAKHFDSDTEFILIFPPFYMAKAIPRHRSVLLSSFCTKTLRPIKTKLISNIS